MATTLKMKTAAIRLEPGQTIEWELSTPEFRQAFRAGNPSAHDALVELIDDKLDELDQELGLIITLSDNDTATAVYYAVFGIINCAEQREDDLKEIEVLEEVGNLLPQPGPLESRLHNLKGHSSENENRC